MTRAISLPRTKRELKKQRCVFVSMICFLIASPQSVLVRLCGVFTDAYDMDMPHF